MWKLANLFASMTAAIVSFVGLLIVIIVVLVFVHFIYLLLTNQA